MADKMEGKHGDTLPPPTEPKAKFSISDSSLDKIESKPENDKTKDTESAGKSRFKVAKVEFVNEDPKQKTESGEGKQALGDGGDPERRSRSASDRASDVSSPPISPYQTDSYSTYNTYSYDTHNLKTFGHNTLETLPHLDHYRNILSATAAIKKRPTLLELHDHDKVEAELIRHHQNIDPLLPEENGLAQQSKPDVVEDVKIVSSSAPKFGWIKGVLVRCLLNIWGVMLFLRLSWVVGQAGIGLATAIILLSGVVTTITALSMSAICTNGEVKGGGAYYMISRSLGPEFGGAIGLIFSVANAVAVAMYVVGFAETIRDILKAHNCLMIDEINDVRIISVLTLTFLLGIAIIGMEWEARAQIGLLIILLIAIANFLIGSVIPPTTEAVQKGFVGYSAKVFSANWGPDFRNKENFFSVFSIFFPAATGILAGANISGDLANAQSSIPKGTLLSILISTIVYIGMAWIVGAVVVRDAAGPLIAPPTVSTLINSTVTVTNGSLLMFSTTAPSVVQDNSTQEALSCERGSCPYGLMNDMQVMELVSGWGPLILAGIFSATLSSALASLVSAPKVFQAVCKDKIFPKIDIFAKGYGKAEEPRRAYFLAYLIAFCFCCIGMLNDIAPIISNFFLMSYTLINYSCFDASLAKSPGWRPAFKFYSMWLSLLGAILCLGVMFIINWWCALLTFLVITTLYVYVHHSKPDVNWGSSTQAHVYRNALTSTLKLITTMDHIKNYRPQILVLTGFPMHRIALVDFVSNLTKNIGLMVCGHIILNKSENLQNLRTLTRDAYHCLQKRKVKAFYSVVTAPSMRAGGQSMLQCVGVGKMKPNILVIGFKSHWNKSKPEDIEEYFNVIHDAFDMNLGVGILRLREGLDCSCIFNEDNAAEMEEVLCYKDHETSPSFFPFEHLFTPVKSEKIDEEESPETRDALPDVTESVTKKPDVPVVTKSGQENSQSPEYCESQEEGANAEKVELITEEMKKETRKDEDKNKKNEHRNSSSVIKGSSEKINKDLLKMINRFHRKQKRGTIDVWWLFDDGGLTLLVPYILSGKSNWSNCKLRVFTAATKKHELDRDQRQMATLLSKFRIDYSTMEVIPDIGKRPSDETIKEFRALIEDWMLDESKGETSDTHPWKISKDELQAQKDKTYRQMRLRELLFEHSRDAALIVMTLPIPRKGLCSSGLYMAWLDTLTRDMPPILLLRGNQDSVLTYYS